MMTKKTRSSAILTAVLLAPFAALADPPYRDVQFDVPLDLEDLPNIITKVGVECAVTIKNVTPANDRNNLVRTGRTEVNVVGGAVLQTVQVLVTVPSITKAIPNIPSGGRSDWPTYVCKLQAFLDEGLGWQEFITHHRPSGSGGGTNTGAVAVLTPVPVPITGDFQW